MLENLKYLSQTNKIAALFEHDELSYRDLYYRTQALAHFLMDNTDVNEPIAIYGDKENDMIVAFFACILIKKTYIALPSVYPGERLDLIIGDCNPDVIFNATSNKYNSKEIKEINSKDIDEYLDLYRGCKEIEYSYSDLDKTALIIYTSGSTGKPKGVEISYQNLEAHIVMDNYAMDNIDKRDDEDYRVMNVASYGFVACLNIFHLCGYRGCTILSLPSEKLSNIDFVVSEIMRFKPLFFAATPSFIRRFLGVETFCEKQMPFFKRLALAGEPLDKSLVNDLLNVFPQLQIMNIYGSTETAGIGSICYVNQEAMNSDNNYIPIDDGKIGLLKLIDENDDYIDEDNVEGDCVFVKPAVSNGYFKNEELTKEKFAILKNGEKVFKIGDVGYRENTYVYIKGRVDNLVKIGGNRIEIEDVEANLSRCKIVEEVAVVCSNDSGINSLTAFLALKGEYKNLSNVEAFLNIKNEMKKKAETYKIPQRIIIVDSLPRNTSSKIDRKKLKEIIKNRYE